MAYVIVSFVGHYETIHLFLPHWYERYSTRVDVERFASATVTPAAGTILRFEPGSEGYWQRLMERLGRRVGSNDVERTGRFRRKLIMAGLQNPRAVMVVLGAKVALGAAGGMSYMLYSLLVQRIVPNVLVVTALLTVAGFSCPISGCAAASRSASVPSSTSCRTCSTC
jgi:hypothetical protein